MSKEKTFFCNVSAYSEFCMRCLTKFFFSTFWLKRKGILSLIFIVSFTLYFIFLWLWIFSEHLSSLYSYLLLSFCLCLSIFLLFSPSVSFSFTSLIIFVFVFGFIYLSFFDFHSLSYLFHCLPLLFSASLLLSLPQTLKLFFFFAFFLSCWAV